ncbi:coiled-coil domain-containing protein 73 isoform X1 [Octopus bimaculoides]|uniref:coiled-coil domain-containing protein 73 isoform X1 n=2 Tax=Octopus bimaculoides TaxID=37653 RepID=UPI0022E2CF5F|nr:coiled-coil domain-containing protein 73 isoform X1 [Octopus bimaculoides]XP_052832385.1 coiled-coil domain-containing protein 73 isoform X1 [Octopus bimaculoides]
MAECQALHAPEEKTAIFNTSNYLNLQHTLLEIVEELKVRRKNDNEYEERMQDLRKTNLELSKNYNIEQKNNSNCIEQCQKRIQEAYNEYEQKILLNGENMEKFRLLYLSKEDEITALKEEIKNLQLENFGYQKQIKDQEQKIELQLMIADHHVKQMSQVESKFISINTHIQALGLSQKSLKENVQNSCQLQQKLERVNKHVRCQWKQCNADLASLQQEILQMKICAQSAPKETVNARQLQDEITKYQQHINKLNIEKEETLKQLEKSNQKNDILMKNLTNVQNLLKYQTENAKKFKMGFGKLEKESKEITDMNLATTQQQQLQQLKQNIEPNSLVSHHDEPKAASVDT